GRHTRFSRDWSSDVCSSDLRSCAASGLVSARRTGSLPFRSSARAWSRIFPKNRATSPMVQVCPSKTNQRVLRLLRDWTIGGAQRQFPGSYPPSGEIRSRLQAGCGFGPRSSRNASKLSVHRRHIATPRPPYVRYDAFRGLAQRFLAANQAMYSLLGREWAAWPCLVARSTARQPQLRLPPVSDRSAS